jgi:hypothetical protein
VDGRGGDEGLVRGVALCVPPRGRARVGAAPTATAGRGARAAGLGLRVVRHALLVHKIVEQEPSGKIRWSDAFCYDSLDQGNNALRLELPKLWRLLGAVWALLAFAWGEGFFCHHEFVQFVLDIEVARLGLDDDDDGR